jgi:hypothetical protein
MDALRSVLAAPDSITTRSLVPSNRVVSDALAADPSAASSALAHFFFSVDSPQVMLPFIKATRDSLSKTALLDPFHSLMLEHLQHSVWTAAPPNLSALENALTFADHSLILGTDPAPFVTLVARELISNPRSVRSKLFEPFLAAFPAPTPFNDSDFPDPLADLLGARNSYTVLGSAILDTLDISSPFDPLLLSLLALARMLFVIVPRPQLEQLYGDTESPLKTLLCSKMAIQLFILFLSLLSLSLNNPVFADYCFAECRKQLQAFASPVDRIFAYNSLSRIVNAVTDLVELTTVYMDSLIRDFDSANSLIYSSLRLIRRAILKEGKASGQMDRLSSLMLEKVGPLSWRSKVKQWIFPQCLPFVESSEFLGYVFAHLIEYSQDLTDAGFITRCVKSLAKSEPVCSGLIRACKDAVTHSKIDGDLVVLRPILRPVFEFQPEFVARAFRELTSPEVFVDVWLHFECMHSSPRSKWPLDVETIRSDVRFAAVSGNWDLRAAAFETFVHAGFPVDDSDVKWFAESFENFIWFESPKHITILAFSFTDFLNRLSLRAKTLDPAPLLRPVLDIASLHLYQPFISAHRQFALQFVTEILAAFPGLAQPAHLIAIASVLWDPNTTLGDAARGLIERLRSDAAVSAFFGGLGDVLDAKLRRANGSASEASTGAAVSAVTRQRREVTRIFSYFAYRNRS